MSQPEIHFEKKPKRYDSVIVLIRQGQHWLMVHNKNRAWEFPGGHCEVGEDFIQTATREAFEESGCLIKNIEHRGYFCLPSGHVTVIVMAKIEKLDKLPNGFETDERRFFKTLPSDISFKDGIYAKLLNHCTAVTA